MRARGHDFGHDDRLSRHDLGLGGGGRGDGLPGWDQQALAGVDPGACEVVELLDLAPVDVVAQPDLIQIVAGLDDVRDGVGQGQLRHLRQPQ